MEFTFQNAYVLLELVLSTVIILTELRFWHKKLLKQGYIALRLKSSLQNSTVVVIILLTVTKYRYLKCLQLLVAGLMSYLRYLCLLAHSGVQHILCCGFVLFFFVSCTLCFQFLYIVHFWFPVTGRLVSGFPVTGSGQ